MIAPGRGTVTLKHRRPTVPFKLSASASGYATISLRATLVHEPAVMSMLITASHSKSRRQPRSRV
jgi:hypothetical protein